ncbi:MAG: VWA domain-containing protein [Candidatus Acidiferrales bacterium]
MIRTFSSARCVTPAIFILTIALGLATGRPADCLAQAAPVPALAVALPLGARTDLVRLDVSVLDKRGNFARGLTQDDFRVLDNGVAQPIVFFAPVEAPARMLVMIETGPAVYLIHDEHLAAAYTLVQGLDHADEVALVTYSDNARRVLDFTSNKAEFIGALNSLQYMIGSGDLNFYDSLSSVVGEISPAGGKTAVVLLATGLDSSAVSHWEPLVHKIRGTDVVVFSVALGGVLRGNERTKTKRKKHAPKSAGAIEQPPDSLDGLTGFAQADRALNLLAQITGGRAYFPQSDKDFASIYREIAATLRHQYVLGIAPAHDGKFHALTVDVFPGGTANAKVRPKKSRYRIFARQGYVAPAN